MANGHFDSGKLGQGLYGSGAQEAVSANNEDAHHQT